MKSNYAFPLALIGIALVWYAHARATVFIDNATIVPPRLAASLKLIDAEVAFRPAAFHGFNYIVVRSLMGVPTTLLFGRPRHTNIDLAAACAEQGACSRHGAEK